MPKFEVSSFGRLYVIDEEIQSLPLVRIIFLIVTAAIGLVVFSRFLVILMSKGHVTLRLTNLLKSTGGRVILLYIISHLIHSMHYVDNIYRPTSYFEPKWLYQKYLISTMEITFFANFPITIAGLYFMERLIDGIDREEYNEVVNASQKMVWYILGSSFTLGHYLTEPPWHYELFINFTIGGEGVATILLALHLVQLRKDSLARNREMMDHFEVTAGLLEEYQKEFEAKRPGIRARTPQKE